MILKGILFSNSKRERVRLSFFSRRRLSAWKGRTDLKSLYYQEGFQVIHLPIPDFGVPSKVDLKGPSEKRSSMPQAGRNIVIHCHAGWEGQVCLWLICKEGSRLSEWGSDPLTRKYIPHALKPMDRKNSLLMMARKREVASTPFIVQPNVNLFFISFSAVTGHIFQSWLDTINCGSQKGMLLRRVLTALLLIGSTLRTLRYGLAFLFCHLLKFGGMILDPMPSYIWAVSEKEGRSPASLPSIAGTEASFHRQRDLCDYLDFCYCSRERGWFFQYFAWWPAREGHQATELEAIEAQFKCAHLSCRYCKEPELWCLS